MCLPKGNACIISLFQTREPVFAFSGRPAKSDKADQVLKVIIDTPRNIDKIEKHRQRQVDGWKDFDRARGK